MDLIARMIFSLLPVKEKIVLSMDRTNWKFGKFNINILMLGITYRNVAFPILFKLMPKRGNSKWTERKELVERFIKLFGKDCIDCLVADREFVGKEWVSWLNSIKLRYYLRVRKNFKVAKGSSNTEIKVIHLVCHLKVGEYACSSCRYNLKGNMVYLVGAHFRASNGVADYQILICFDRPEEGIEAYKKRWQIETLFKGLKSSGFDIEKTHLHDTDRIARLLALVCVAFTWAYLVGIHKDVNVKPLRILKHGYGEKSLVKYGLEEIADVLARPFRTPNFDVFKFLSCS